MATPAPRLLQDQNLNILNNGITPGGKAYAAKADRKGGGLGGRKALNDISNSRKPSMRHSVKKDNNSINVFSTEKPVKPKLTKAPEKGKVSGRKALTDLTNSVKPTSEQAPSLGRKLNVVVDEKLPSCVADERFLHNHQECIAAQMKAVDMEYFLKSTGLHHDMPLQQSARRALPLTPKKLEINAKHMEIEDMPKPELLGYSSPTCHRSPQSPKAPYMSWEDEDLLDLKIIGTPKVT